MPLSDLLSGVLFDEFNLEKCVISSQVEAQQQVVEQSRFAAVWVYWMLFGDWWMSTFGLYFLVI